MIKRRFSTSSFILMVGFQLFFVTSLMSIAGASEQPKIGKKAPSFELVSLKGDTVALANLRGKFVVIHFAASW